MARRRRHKISGWTMLGWTVVLGLLLGPVIMAICFFIAVVKALKESD